MCSKYSNGQCQRPKWVKFSSESKVLDSTGQKCLHASKPDFVNSILLSISNISSAFPREESFFFIPKGSVSLVIVTKTDEIIPHTFMNLC